MCIDTHVIVKHIIIYLDMHKISQESVFIFHIINLIKSLDKEVILLNLNKSLLDM